MLDKTQERHRTNRVFKSLHKPLTYLGVERTLFCFVCVGAVGAFNLFNSILAGIAVFIGGFTFGHWVTNSDPAFLRILAKSERNGLDFHFSRSCVYDSAIACHICSLQLKRVRTPLRRPLLPFRANFNLYLKVPSSPADVIFVCSSSRPHLPQGYLQLYRAMRTALPALAQGASLRTTAKVWNFFAERGG
jgi:hypothetical protein